MATVAVVGLGLMGGSLARALRRARPGLTILGVEPDGRTSRQAMEAGAVTVAGPDLELLDAADVVFLATPVAALRDLLPRLAGVRAVLTDLASTKVQVMAWAAGAGVDLVGGHPMCGREASGFAASDAGLFEGSTWILTRPEPAVVDLVEAVGARPLVMDAEEHDRHVARVSHAAFVLSSAYMRAAALAPGWQAAGTLAASGFRDMTRLAAGDPAMYAGIAATNREQLLAALDEVTAELGRFRRHLEQGDARLEELFEEARAARDRWAGARPG